MNFTMSSCSSETVVGMFDVKKRDESQANLFVGFGCIVPPGESRVGSEFCFKEHRRTCARQGPEPSYEFSRATKMIIRFSVQGNL